MSVNLENMAAVQNLQNESAHIGHLFWYSLSDDLFSRSLLEQTLAQVGLSESFLPRPISFGDAFRRATKEVECSRHPSNGVTENYLVRDVHSDSKVAVRHIVRETVDTQGQRLSYREDEAVLTLDKKTGDMTCHAWGYGRELGNEAQRLFETFKENYGGQVVRNMILNMLKTLSPTPVRPSGGVYFVPSAHDGDLAKLVMFVSSFAKGEAFKIPVVNTEESVRMVEQKVADHLDGILSQCRQAVSNASLTKSKLAEIINESKEVIAGFHDYEKIVSQHRDGMESRISLIRDAVSLLMDKVS
ncbi:hypothetical protein CEB3_c13490 [Peptococcaceae bacterium CEB3]|nr:hypothetical protein CEB3_c13490 [Peptococcaceae bacterium CEB3]